MANHIEFIPLDTYSKKLDSFPNKDHDRIEKAVNQRLSFKPTHGPMLQNIIRVSGSKLVGLRHMKVGVSNAKGGAYILYRYCKECLQNGYYIQSRLQCQFCDKTIQNRIVLFDVNIRSKDYK